MGGMSQKECNYRVNKMMTTIKYIEKQMSEWSRFHNYLSMSMSIISTSSMSYYEPDMLLYDVSIDSNAYSAI